MQAAYRQYVMASGQQGEGPGRPERSKALGWALTRGVATQRFC